MEYKVKMVKIDDIIPYENNVKNHDETQVEQIAESIKQFGFRQNIVIDKDNVIVIGHGRYLASKKLGIEEIPCIKADDLTPEQIKALRIADNKLSEKGEWNNNALKEELLEIEDLIDMTDFGFGEFELDILTSDFGPEPYDDSEIEGFEDIGDNMLQNKRVIITYNEESEQQIKELLGVQEINKVIYDIKEIKTRE